MLAYMVLLRGGIVLLPLGLFFLVTGRGPEVLEAATMLAFLFLGAAIGGLAYSLIGRPMRAIPIVGPYLTGVISIIPYVAAIGAVLNVYRMGADSLLAPWHRFVVYSCIISAVVFGTLIGHFWFAKLASDIEDASV